MRGKLTVRLFFGFLKFLGECFMSQIVEIKEDVQIDGTNTYTAPSIVIDESAIIVAQLATYWADEWQESDTNSYVLGYN